ncbi:MAG TPA: SDR family oxidoreductase, partial [Spongiibacteraceae bacterium]|nr:SDR family oxidoreductase [Spongiibacteraceae bacterium]
MTKTALLAGHRSLIVGGGSGIGYATAELLLSEGATVTIAGRSAEKLQIATTRLAPLAEANGGAIQWVSCDVMNGADVRKAVEVAEGDIKLDSAVTVPGGGHFRPVLGYPDDLFSAEVDMNIRPQYLVLKYAGLAMVRAGGGSIIAVSSTAAKFSSRYLASYCAGKAAVEQLVRVAADELGSKNIRVNAVGPGLTRTDA